MISYERKKIIDRFAIELKSRLLDAIHKKDVNSMENLIDDIAEQFKNEYDDMEEFNMSKKIIITIEDLDDTKIEKIENVIDNALNNNGINCIYNITDVTDNH